MFLQTHSYNWEYVAHSHAIKYRFGTSLTQLALVCYWGHSGAAAGYLNNNGEERLPELITAAGRQEHYISAIKALVCRKISQGSAYT